MDKILIGSQAMHTLFPGEFNRVPKDTDYATFVETRSQKSGVEYLYNPILFSYEKNGIIGKTNLLSLKISHLFWETEWDKHMWDVQFMLGKGVVPDYKLVEDLRDFWEDYLPKVRRSQLNTSKEEFFTNAVNKDTEEHDALHLRIAEVPAYTKILKDGQEVETCPEKFTQLSFEEKRAVVEEETVVMAYERYSGKLHPFPAYRKQLKYNIIKHFPKEVAYYAIENYREFLKVPKPIIHKIGYESRRI